MTLLIGMIASRFKIASESDLHIFPRIPDTFIFFINTIGSLFITFTITSYILVCTTKLKDSLVTYMRKYRILISIRSSGLALEKDGEGLVLRRLQPIVLRILDVVLSLDDVESVGVSALLGPIGLTLVHHISVDEDAGS